MDSLYMEINAQAELWGIKRSLCEFCTQLISY